MVKGYPNQLLIQNHNDQLLKKYQLAVNEL